MATKKITNKAGANGKGVAHKVKQADNNALTEKIARQRYIWHPTPANKKALKERRAQVAFAQQRGCVGRWAVVRGGGHFTHHGAQQV